MDALQKFKLAVSAAFADGDIAAEERSVLLGCARTLGLPRERATALIRTMIHSLASGAKQPLVLPTDADERREVLRMVADVIEADQVVKPEESEFYRRLERALELGPAPEPSAAPEPPLEPDPPPELEPPPPPDLEPPSDAAEGTAP